MNSGCSQEEGEKVSFFKLGMVKGAGESPAYGCWWGLCIQQAPNWRFCNPGLGDRLVRKNSSKIGRWASELRIKPPKVLDCVSPDIYIKPVSPKSISGDPFSTLCSLLEAQVSEGFQSSCANWLLIAIFHLSAQGSSPGWLVSAKYATQRGDP